MKDLKSLDSLACKLLGASTITDNGFSQVNGDACISPGVEATVYPSWIVHVSDTAAVTAHNDAQVLYDTIKNTVTGCETITVNLGLINQQTDPFRKCKWFSFPRVL